MGLFRKNEFKADECYEMGCGRNWFFFFTPIDTAFIMQIHEYGDVNFALSSSFNTRTRFHDHTIKLNPPLHKIRDELSWWSYHWWSLNRSKRHHFTHTPTHTGWHHTKSCMDTCVVNFDCTSNHVILMEILQSNTRSFPAGFRATHTRHTSRAWSWTTA